MHRRLRELSEKHSRYGYRRIAALLRQEGWKAGQRLVQRWRRAEGRRVPPTRRKIPRRGVSTGLPTRATHRGEVWTWDFIADATGRGGSLRRLTILAEHTRECHVLRADRALKSKDVLEWLQKAIEQHGAPKSLRSDNGPEFIARAVQRWLAEARIKTIYIEPGSPWQNGFVESFHGRFRDECLNREQLWTLTEARGGHRRLPAGIQPTKAASQTGRPESGELCAEENFHLRFRSGYALPPPEMDKPE